MFYTYVLRSATHKAFYKGHTSNLSKRVRLHNAGKTKSTKYGAPWQLVYFEAFETRLEAARREKYFKTAAGRRFLKKLDLLDVVEVPMPE